MKEVSQVAGISEEKVLETVKWLRSNNVPIITDQKGTISLSKEIVPLDAELIRNSVSNFDPTFANSIEVFEELDSTNQYLLSKSDSQLQHRQVCLAEFMTVGRGRRGRSWIGGAYQNIMLSIAWRFEKGQYFPGLSLAVAVVVAQFLAAETGAEFKVKWPNDVLFNDKKISGILVEVQNSVAIIGIGVNCSLKDEDIQSIEKPAATLESITSRVPDRNLLVPSLIIRLNQGLQKFSNKGFSCFRSEWMKLHAHSGMRACSDSTPQITGTIVDVDETGALRIREDSGAISLISSGEVSVRTNNSF